MKVVVAGGGTGGHIYPAVAVIDALRQGGHSVEVTFMGTRRGLESGIVPALGYRMYSIIARPLPPGRNLELILSLVCAVAGMIQSLILLGWKRPHMVVGTGGYTCGPVVVAARILGIPILLIEPNSIPGRAVKLLARFADEVALGFQESIRYFARGTNLRVTGVPIRSVLASCSRQQGLARFELEPQRKTVFVFGGSRGASSINRALVEAVRVLDTRDDLQFIIQTGGRDYQYVRDAVSGLEVPCRVYPYIEDIGFAYAASDLVVCRAGAGTVAELTACGLPAILIPYPHATARHQEANARLLESHQACYVILDRDLNGRLLAQAIISIIDDEERLRSMGASSRQLGRPDAAVEIAGRLAQLADRRGRLSKLATVLGELCSAR